MPLFLRLALDPVKNVRIVVSRVLETHFKNENGAFVFDHMVNQAVKILKKDFCLDVRQQLEHITTYPLNDTADVDLPTWKEELSRLEAQLVDTDSESESNSSHLDINQLNSSVISGPTTVNTEETDRSEEQKSESSLMEEKFQQVLDRKELDGEEEEKKEEVKEEAKDEEEQTEDKPEEQPVEEDHV